MQKSLTKNSIYNVIYTIANILFPFATSIYVSRILLPVGVGKVASAQNIVSYFVTLAALLLDKVVYYNISNYAVPFFYACTGYFLIVKQPEKDLHTKLSYRIKKIFNIYIIWSIVYLPLTVYGWFIEGNKTVE